MKLAGAGALDALGDLLNSLRARSTLVEKRPGIFYVRDRAFLHFHEDRAGLFADLRQGGEWQRLPVNDPDDHARLLAAVDQALERASGPRCAVSVSSAELPAPRFYLAGGVERS